MKKLISMTDFVLEQELELRNYFEYDNREALVKIFNYAHFLKQPLELWMFVPCKLVDGVWVVLDAEPCSLGMCAKGNPFYDVYLESKKEYQQAKERCLFDGFEYKHIKTTYDNYYIINNKNITWLSWNNLKTIESLLNYNQDLQLTQTAIKQLGL